MTFFNSFSIRAPLALVGGILYALLTHAITTLLDLPKSLAISLAVIVFLFYLGSRALLIFLGINTPYYSKEGKDSHYENTIFYQTAQWVGRFYHYHDVGLFIFLSFLTIVFAISIIIDGIESRPFGETIFDWNKMIFWFLNKDG